MSTEAYLFLVFKKQQEGLTPAEADQLAQWLAEAPEHQRAAAEAERLLQIPLAQAPPANTEAELLRLHTRLRAEAEPVLQVTHRRPLPWRWAAAAAVALLVGAFFFVKKTTQPTVEMVAVVAANGDTQRLTLPDGSVVVLRQGAQLRHPNTFAGLAERRVELTGEAFFEVQKDPAHPFVVLADGGCQTRVLGTQFNVRATPTEPTVAVELREGSVRVSGADGGTSAVLQPGQRAVFDKKSQQIAVATIETAAVADWRSAEMSFQKTSLNEVAERLSRRFNQRVVVDNADLAASCSYTAYFPQASLAAILKNLESVFDLHADTLPDGTCVLRGGRCPGPEN